MSLNLNGNVTGIYLGSTKADAVYLGNAKVFEDTPVIPTVTIFGQALRYKRIGNYYITIDDLEYIPDDANAIDLTSITSWEGYSKKYPYIRMTNNGVLDRVLYHPATIINLLKLDGSSGWQLIRDSTVASMLRSAGYTVTQKNYGTSTGSYSVDGLTDSEINEMFEMKYLYAEFTSDTPHWGVGTSRNGFAGYTYYSSSQSAFVQDDSNSVIQKNSSNSTGSATLATKRFYNVRYMKAV